MPCPRCGYENPPNTRFCARCNCNLQADAGGYNPNEQMKVILPSVVTPIERVPLHATPASNDEPLETVIISKPTIPPAKPPVTPPAATPPQAEPPKPVANGPSMAPVIPPEAKPQAAPKAPAAEPLPTLVLGAEALAAIATPAAEPPPKKQASTAEPLRTVVLEQKPRATIAHPTVIAEPPKTAKPGATPKSAAKTAHPPELAKQATNFSIAIGTASVVLLIVAASYYVLEMRSGKAPETTLPPAVISAPVPAVVASAPPAPPPAVSEPAPQASAAPAIPASAPEPAPVQAPEPPPAQPAAATTESKTSLAQAETAASATPQTGPHMLSNQEIAALLKTLKKHSIPRDCNAASQMLVSEYAVLAKQAGRIAKQAYPDLCAPAPKPVVEPAPAPTRTTPPPARTPTADAPPPPPRAKTLDEIYEERIGAECSKGAFGHICRETTRLKLCSGKISDNPPAGQTVCKQ